MELNTSSYEDYLLSNRARVNIIINKLFWMFSLLGPALAGCIKFGFINSLRYPVCIEFSLLIIVLSAIHLLFVRKIPDSIVTTYTGIFMILGFFAYMTYRNTNIFTSFMIVPIISIFYCQRSIFIVASAATLFDIEFSLFRRFQFNMAVGKQYFFEAVIEFLIIFVTGFILSVRLREYFYTLYLKQREAVDNKQNLEKQFGTLQTLVDIYLTVHLIDLKKKVFAELKSTRELNKVLLESKYTEADDVMNDVMKVMISPLYIEQILYFTNLNTVADRIGNNRIISLEFIGNVSGWCRASFIPVERDEKGKVIKVLFTTQGIDEEKKNEENLIKLSRVDKLTELGNRAAYEASVKLHEIDGLNPDFTIIQLDVNGLKRVNDNQGHVAGDELIQGAADCIKKSFGDKTECFRVGGDEFCVILETSVSDLEEKLSLLQKNTKLWKGHLVPELNISYGYARTEEFPYTEVIDMAEIADERMYQMKKEFYQKHPAADLRK